MTRSNASKKTFADETFLVCGGCGFMGSNFIRLALLQNPKLAIINLDSLTYAGNLRNLDGISRSRHRFVKGNICDTKLMTKLMRRADMIVNFAAETHVDRSIHGGADAFIRTNIVGLHSLLKALRASPNIKKMLHISTDEVYGDLPIKSKKKFTEKSPLLPNSPYAASKAAGDLLIHSYVNTHRLPIIGSHSENKFGPRQFPEKLIPFFVLQALVDKNLPLYGDGRNIRDWIYVDDHSRAICTLLAKGVPGETYGISAAEEHSNREIVEVILRALKKSLDLIAFVADRPGHDRRYAIEAKKIRLLGWRPTYLFSKALEETIRWYKNNHSWVADVYARTKSFNPHIHI